MCRTKRGEDLIVKRQQVIPHKQRISAESDCAGNEREAFAGQRPRSDSDVPYQTHISSDLRRRQGSHVDAERDQVKIVAVKLFTDFMPCAIAAFSN